MTGFAWVIIPQALLWAVHSPFFAPFLLCWGYPTSEVSNPEYFWMWNIIWVWAVEEQKAGFNHPAVGSFQAQVSCPEFPLLFNTHLGIFGAGMGVFCFLIMYWQPVPSQSRNNSESIWETVFPFLITNPVELFFIIPQTYLFMMQINLGICYQEDTSRAFFIKEFTFCGWTYFLNIMHYFCYCYYC